MDTLIKQLNAVYPLTEALIERLKATIKVKEFAKRDYILRAGHICRNLYYIEQGLLRCFHQNKMGKDVSTWFMMEGDFVISVESFYRQKPSNEFIQALEDCILFYIEYKDLQQIYRDFIEYNVNRAVLTEHYYVLGMQRNFALQIKTAKERYTFLIDNFPKLIQRVPSKYLASYLRITEETLSRIRGKK